MRRTNTAFNILNEAPANGFVEVVQDAAKSKESRRQLNRLRVCDIHRTYSYTQVFTQTGRKVLCKSG